MDGSGIFFSQNEDQRNSVRSTRATHVGFAVGGYRVIGLRELVGVVGLFASWAVTGLGVAAACLLLLLSGAALAHLRAGDRPPALLPAIVWVVPVAAYLIVLFQK
ncbi:DoxX family protein [Streptomyces sp. NPDC047061]|uniref:DoxX family protein n=1 Tax=Streptomyces sp. NPDC047061 TaxID=3154605 RepID=UPI0033C2DB05